MYKSTAHCTPDIVAQQGRANLIDNNLGNPRPQNAFLFQLVLSLV